MPYRLIIRCIAGHEADSGPISSLMHFNPRGAAGFSHGASRRRRNRRGPDPSSPKHPVAVSPQLRSPGSPDRATKMTGASRRRIFNLARPKGKLCLPKTMVQRTRPVHGRPSNFSQRTPRPGPFAKKDPRANTTENYANVSECFRADYHRDVNSLMSTFTGGYSSAPWCRC